MKFPVFSLLTGNFGLFRDEFAADSPLQRGVTSEHAAASTFTGYWFVRELVAAGHEVVAACRGDGRYEGLRAERVRMVRELCETRFGCAFGNDDFLTLAKSPFDVLCHHGAEVGDYRNPDFDPYRAAAANLHRLPEVLRALKDGGAGGSC
jgi:nucleoside-diphosphate-sugar epimerase